MAITYASNTITVSGEGAFNCDDIYNAAAVPAGVKHKDGTYYRFDAKLNIINNSYFSDTNKRIDFNYSSSGYIYVSTNSTFQIGTKDANGNVFDGCFLRIRYVATSMWSSGGQAGNIKLYDSTIDMPGAFFRVYRGPTQVFEMIGCIVQAWSGGRIEGDGTSCILNCYIHHGTTYGMAPKGPGVDMNNILVTLSAYSVYYSSSSGGHVDATMYNIKGRNNTTGFRITTGTGHLIMVNPDFDAWTFSGLGSLSTKVYRQYEFNLTVLNEDGAVITGAKVKGDYKSGVCFAEETVNASGNLAVNKVLTKGYYKASGAAPLLYTGDGTGKDFEYSLIRISATGYNTVIKRFSPNAPMTKEGHIVTLLPRCRRAYIT